MEDHESAEARERLIVGTVPLVHTIVREVASRVPASVDRADLVSAGLTALVAAAAAYEPDRGVPFTAYARTRVRGALLDELRSHDWATRSVRRTARDIEAVRNRLAATLGQVPDPAAVAAAMGVDVEVVRRCADDLARAVVLSLDDEIGSPRAHLLPAATPGPEETVERRERLEVMSDAVQELPERLRAVVRGYFLEERPMTELAAELGVTESRISQMRAEALVLLRSALNDAFEASCAVPVARPGSIAERRRASYVASVAQRHAARRSRAAAGAPSAATA